MLSRREREDFIELFYLFVCLKLIDHYHPHSISFTCKDALDTGAAESAAFYAFVKMLSTGFESKEELDYFRWILYAPALFVRERAIDLEQFNRVLTALERLDQVIQQDKKGLLKDVAELYHPQLFKTLQVE